MAKDTATVYGPLPIKVRFKGDFDIEDFYKEILKWFKENRFKWYEKRYKDKPSPFQGREIEIEIYGEYKQTEYYKHTVDVKIHAWEYHEKDIMINNKKKKIGTGKVHVTINGAIISDYKNKFPKEADNTEGKLYVFFGSIMKALTKNDILLKQIGYLDPKLQELANRVKKKLKMESIV